MNPVRPVELPRNRILVGDAATRLGGLPDHSVDAVITSPPYFGLRDYGDDAQVGLEPDVDAWVARLRDVCREITRVLKPGGSLWLNLGDGYSSQACQGAKKKSLLLGPQRLSLALVDDGWIIRNQVIWSKSNPMPSSVRDRLSCTYEVVLFLVRSRYYFFDLDAIREPLRSAASPSGGGSDLVYPPPPGRPIRRYNDNRGLGRLKAAGLNGHPLGKNPGDVWRLATGGFAGAHFATFPPRLVERPLMASCPERICVACGAAWRPASASAGQDERLQPACACQDSWHPGVVLDPFMGAGTVGVVAEKHGRDWIGIELNQKYVALAERRIQEARTRLPGKQSSLPPAPQRHSLPAGDFAEPSQRMARRAA